MLDNSEFVSIIDDSILCEIMSANENLILDNYFANSRSLAVCGLQNNMKLYFSTANSGSYDQTYLKAASIIKEVRESGDINNHVIVTTDVATVDNYLVHENISCYERDGEYFLYSSLRSN